MVSDLLGNVVLDNQYPQSQRRRERGHCVHRDLDAARRDRVRYRYPNAIIGRPAAGKTGTTSSFRDAWFVGFTPDLVTAVWLGNDDYTRMNESYGGNIPARIWARFMRAALARTPPHPFVQPNDEVVKLDCGGITDYHLSSSQNDASLRNGARGAGEREPAAAGRTAAQRRDASAAYADRPAVDSGRGDGAAGRPDRQAAARTARIAHAARAGRVGPSVAAVTWKTTPPNRRRRSWSASPRSRRV